MANEKTESLVVKFKDGTSHTYENVPVGISPKELDDRISKDFPNQQGYDAQPVTQPVVQEPPKNAFESFLGRLKDVEPLGFESPTSHAIAKSFAGETLKNIGAATQLLPVVGEKYGTPMVKAGEETVQKVKEESPVSGTVGQIGSYVLPLNTLTKGANLIAKGTGLLPQILKSGTVSGVVSGLTTPGTAEERIVPTAINTGVGAALPVAAKGVEAVGKKIAPMLRNIPSQEELINKAKGLFGKAEESGIQLNAKNFATEMGSIGKGLRAEGYDADLMPKVAVALKHLTNTKNPKDYQELSTLRTFIRNAQKSKEPDEQRVATILKDKFDSYISNIPEEHIGTASKEGLQAWKEARDTYSKASKAEVFEDMLYRSELDKNKYTQSGAENSLALQLRALAKDDKRMRLFTPAEQEEIIKASKGNAAQNFLRMIGKYAPTSPITMGIGAGIGAHLGGPLGAAIVPVVGEGSKMLATKLRQNAVNNLADYMRAGGEGFDVGSRLQLTPTQQNLAKLLMLQQTAQENK